MDVQHYPYTPLHPVLFSCSCVDASIEVHLCDSEQIMGFYLLSTADGHFARPMEV